MNAFAGIVVSVMLAASLHADVTIAILPMGEVKVERVEVVRKGLEEAFGSKVEVLAVTPLPKEAWHAPRSRYRAEKLLDFLAGRTPERFRVVLALTSKDISTTKGTYGDWGVFGLGEVDGRACVVSTFRLGARGADETKLRDRLRKVAIHEAGHVMGLEHCPEQGCVMRDAESSIATVDAASGNFCASCRGLISK